MEIIKFLHSYWAYVVLLAVIAATGNALFGMLTKKEFGAKDFRLALFGLIATHLQLLIGIMLFALVHNFGEIDMGEIMKSASLRLKNVEHPVMMIVAITLLTMGYSKHKNKRTSAAKFKTLSVFYTLALIAICAMLPWKAWLG